VPAARGREGAHGSEHGRKPRVHDPVQNVASPSPSGHEAAPLQAGQVVREAAPGVSCEMDQLLHRALSLKQRLEDLEARGVSEDPEVAGVRRPQGCGITGRPRRDPGVGVHG
jgi:hypothetical protein